MLAGTNRPKQHLAPAPSQGLVEARIRRISTMEKNVTNAGAGEFLTIVATFPSFYSSSDGLRKTLTPMCGSYAKLLLSFLHHDTRRSPDSGI